MKELKLQYGSEETSISLLVDMSVGIGGDKWPAADQFCSLISDPKWTPFFHGLFDGKRVIELGSGNGLAGILASKLYHPDEVIISDLASHIPLIAQNIKLNECLNCIALEFDWFSPPTLPLFDIIMAFECVYNEDLYLPLINSLVHVSSSSSIIFLGLTRLFAKSNFFDLLKKEGFFYKMLPKEVFVSEYWEENTGRDVSLFILSRGHPFSMKF